MNGIFTGILLNSTSAVSTRLFTHHIKNPLQVYLRRTIFLPPSTPAYPGNSVTRRSVPLSASYVKIGRPGFTASTVPEASPSLKEVSKIIRLSGAKTWCVTVSQAVNFNFTQYDYTDTVQEDLTVALSVTKPGMDDIERDMTSSVTLKNGAFFPIKWRVFPNYASLDL